MLRLVTGLLSQFIIITWIKMIYWFSRASEYYDIEIFTILSLLDSKN